jgi:type IV secretion system protein VirB5
MSSQQPHAPRPVATDEGAALPDGAPSLGDLPIAEPPYVRGRAEFYGAFADLAKGKRNWQLAAFGALGLAGVLAAGLVTMATQSRILPYVVEVDRLGEAQALGPAASLATVDERVIRRDVAGFVRDVRAVVGDAAAQRDLLTRAYAFAGPEAAAFLNAYFAEPANDPRRLGRDLTRLVEITGVLPVPTDDAGGGPPAARTWKVSWTERSIPRAAGGLPGEAAWEGYFTTRIVPPARADARLTLNPLGVTVTRIHWTELARRAEAGGTPAPIDAADGRDSGARP